MLLHLMNGWIASKHMEQMSLNLTSVQHQQSLGDLYSISWLFFRAWAVAGLGGNWHTARK